MSLRVLPDQALIAGWDFSTGAVKCLIFDLSGRVLIESRFPTDLVTDGGVSEFNYLQLEGQARATTREVAKKLEAMGRLQDWVAGGISATHHTAGRVDQYGNQVRRMICWNDQTLAQYHAEGLARLGGPNRVQELIGGPWAVRYSLSHLVKDAHTLSIEDWSRTAHILPHGPAAAAYLVGNFNVISISSAASTGMMDLRTNEWSRGMLDCLESSVHREQVWNTLPTIQQDMTKPIGVLTESIAADAGLPAGVRPAVFPTLDDQAAGLLGGGAVDDGEVAIILGNSAVVNSSAVTAPKSGSLDAMKLNWGPYLWMRCYSNGAQFLDRIVGPKPDWPTLEKAARAVPPGCNGVSVLPFVLSEPSIGVTSPRVEWFPAEPTDVGVRFRAALEAIAYLIALAVKEHEAAGTVIRRITISGGIAKSQLMGEILASVINKPLDRLQSSEGTALGAAVIALAGIENHLRQQRQITEPYTVAEAVKQLVKFTSPVQPVVDWIGAYAAGLTVFRQKIS